MLFKFPKKKIVLDCFTTDTSVIEYAPIHYAIKHIPEWWKNLPARPPTVEHRTARQCAGIIDYYKKSIAIPLWSDCCIEFLENGMYRWYFADGKSHLDTHNVSQRTGFLDEYLHLKFMSPWNFKSEKGINWVWSHPTYNYAHSNDIVCLPGIAEYHYQSGTNINMMLPYEKSKKFFIPQGQPLALLTPMSDRKVEIVRHLVTEAEIKKLRDRVSSITFVDKYKASIKRKEQFLDCPYHDRVGKNT
jgi:hypothetical protein